MAEIEKGFYNLRRGFEEDERAEALPEGPLYCRGILESVYTGRTYLSFLQPVGKRSILVHNIPEDVVSIKGEDIYLREHVVDTREIREKRDKKYDELKEEYEAALESSDLINKLKGDK
ncbi:MAG: hypothetical protein ACOC1P_05955 [Minisyncoccales bacterium]